MRDQWKNAVHFQWPIDFFELLSENDFWQLFLCFDTYNVVTYALIP